MAAEGSDELGNIDQTSLEKRGAKDTRISPGGESSVDPAIPGLFVDSCTKYLRSSDVCITAVTFVFCPVACCVSAP